MGSIHAAKPVKLFISIVALPDSSLEERLEERLISEFGSSDHRLSLIPTDGTIHRVFLSFNRLIETESLAKIRELSKSIEKEFRAKLDVGFLDNRNAVVGIGDVEDVFLFKDGGIHFSKWTDPGYRSDKTQDFFLSMRKTFRSQLRTMCLLRR